MQNINPNTLKGRELLERSKYLMGITTLSENKLSKSAVELTKRGPDGKVYGIVRENHEYFIKTTDKKTNIKENDFKYIGGLANYREKVYPSYSKASKGLNLTFISIAESLGKTNTINVLENDNLLEYDSYNDEPGYDDVDSKPSKRWDADDAEDIEDDEIDEETKKSTPTNHGKHIMEDADMSESDKAIDSMLMGKSKPVTENYIKNTRLKISTAINRVSENETKNKQFKTLLESLSQEEKDILIETLKKKV